MRASAGRVRVIRRTPAANNGSGPGPSKGGRRTKLTQDVEDTIVRRIENGAYDWVAAQAGGIHRATFTRWMGYGREGLGGRDAPKYRAFYDRVMVARSACRAEAEAAVRREEPFKWLRYGPGRERPGEPGWTDSAQISGPEGGPVPVALDESDEHLAEVLQILRDLDIADREAPDGDQGATVSRSAGT